MKKILAVALYTLSFACSVPKTDHAKYERIFKECLAAAPKPVATTTQYNDMDEIIYECRVTARYIATE